MGKEEKGPIGHGGFVGSNWCFFVVIAVDWVFEGWDWWVVGCNQWVCGLFMVALRSVVVFGLVVVVEFGY